MKKLFFGVLMMLGFSGLSNAQQASPSAPVTKKKLVRDATVSSVPAPVATNRKVKKTSTTVVAKPTTATGVVLKKDGTPDKRYKKAPATEAGPLKKDGTADMRYKKNKKS